MKNLILLLSVTSVFTWSDRTFAHVPYTSEQAAYSSAEEAFSVQEPDISQVIYHEVTCDTLYLWMTFEAESGFLLTSQVGVPVLERLSDYRPNLALVGPGLPEANVPFKIPSGLGAVVYESAAEPEEFYEPFSGTSSWTVVDLDEQPLAETGRYYLVAWPPDRRTGKLWMSVGTGEDFSAISGEELFETVDKVKVFHEIEGELDTLEGNCPLEGGPVDVSPLSDDSAGSGDTTSSGLPDSDTGSGSCSVGSTASPWFLSGIPLVLAFWRRRAAIPVPVFSRGSSGARRIRR